MQSFKLTPSLLFVVYCGLTQLGIVMLQMALLEAGEMLAVLLLISTAIWCLAVYRYWAALSGVTHQLLYLNHRWYWLDDHGQQELEVMTPTLLLPQIIIMRTKKNNESSVRTMIWAIDELGEQRFRELSRCLHSHQRSQAYAGDQTYG